ncbi:hypothetical protein IQ235_11490 [Oscillatoriales cyanobacterium LEGE 11467]|uniref:Glycosyltransferase RgtA/B/C/D-like domain-containing protein n=1 Tax=Zarconia navalis LEGE 11467 TaxID=1828826 RepID=A0A928W176_9CYAN|nr:glycosyltransferase family 39 protein [Zarconia navalis]MBE9041405.1 hypothetical protein [Zarconia navalis LEGE 11467]
MFVRLSRTIWQDKLFYFISFLTLTYTIVTRIDKINSGLWNDESNNYFSFIKKGLLQIVWSDRFSPANHILNSIFAWISYKIFGFSEVMLRMPSLIAGILASILFFFFLKSKLGKLEALLFFVFAALCSEHIKIVSQLRGYGLCYLFSVIALIMAYRAIGDRENSARFRKSILIFSIVNFLAIYNFIPFVLLSCSFYLVLFFYLKGFRRIELSISAILSIALCGIAYIPAISSLSNSYSSGFGQIVPKLHLLSFLSIPPRKIISFYIAQNIKSTAILSFYFLLCSIVLILGYYFARKKDENLANLLVIPPSLTLLMGGVLKAPLGSAISHPRYTCFLTFYYLAVFSIGLAYFFTLIYQKVQASRNGNEAIFQKNIYLFFGVTALCTILIFQGFLISDKVFIIRGHYKEATQAIEAFNIKKYKIFFNPSPNWAKNDAEVYFSEKLPNIQYKMHSIAKDGKAKACQILQEMNEITNTFVVEDLRLEYIPNSTYKVKDYAIVTGSDRQEFKVISWQEKNRLLGVYFFQRGQVSSMDCEG